MTDLVRSTIESLSYKGTNVYLGTSYIFSMFSILFSINVIKSYFIKSILLIIYHNYVLV